MIEDKKNHKCNTDDFIRWATDGEIKKKRREEKNIRERMREI